MRKMLAFEGAAAFQLEVYTSSDEAVTLEILGMTREGPFKYSFVTNGTLTPETQYFPIPDIPICITLKLPSLPPKRNAVYALVFLRINKTRTQLLCQGFVDLFHSISFPNLVPMTQSQLTGAPRNLASADPAAGAEATITIPSYVSWIVRQVTVTLVTDATVADRAVALEYYDVSANLTYCVSAAVQIASKTVVYHWFVGAAVKEDATSGYQNAPLVDGLILLPGYRLRTKTKNIQAADNFGIMRVYYEQYPTFS